MRVVLHAGPSHASWMLANAIVAQAMSRGLSVVDRDPEAPVSPGQPDWVLSSGTGTEKEGLVVIVGPDFVAADLGQMDVSQLADHFRHRSMPCVSGTRWFASSSVAAAESAGGILLINAERKAIDLDGLGPLECPADLGELRAADPALGVYGSTPSPGARAFWSPVLFTAAAYEQTADVAEWVDMTGRIKAVADDPGMSLGAGPWSIEWLVDVNPEGGVVDLLFQWGDQELLEIVRRPARYSVTQSAQWAVGGHARARIQSFRPHFQGRARLVGAVVTRLKQALGQGSEAPIPPTEP